MEASKSVTEHRSQYLTFEVSHEHYAIAILDLREIISFQSATRVPMAPKSIRGLINLRGSAVPVIDLAMKFGETPTEVSKRTCVMVLDSSTSNERGTIGILADSVSEVIELLPDEIEDAPDFGATIASDYLVGLARVFDQFVPILDVDRILSFEEKAVVQGASPGIEVGEDDCKVSGFPDTETIESAGETLESSPEPSPVPAKTVEGTTEPAPKPRRSSKKKSKS